MAQLSVSFGHMQAGIADIKATHGNLQSLFSELQGHIQQLQPTWSGPAADAWLGVQIQWGQVQQLLADGLFGIGLGVDTALQNYLQAERTNTNGWA